MTELLPCPFCGGEAEDFQSQQDTLFYVQCQNCMAKTGPIFLTNSHNEAIAAWNTRSAASVDDEMVERAKLAIAEASDYELHSVTCEKYARAALAAVTP